MSREDRKYVLGSMGDDQTQSDLSRFAIKEAGRLGVMNPFGVYLGYRNTREIFNHEVKLTEDMVYGYQRDIAACAAIQSLLSDHEEVEIPIVRSEVSPEIWQAFQQCGQNSIVFERRDISKSMLRENARGILKEVAAIEEVIKGRSGLQ